MARPSRVLTSVPQPAGHSRQVLAYQYGTPGRMSCWAARYGMSLLAGVWAQPAAVPASPMPTSFRKSRRLKVKSSLIGRSSVVTRQTVHARREVRVVQILAMATDAPAHLERGVLVDDVHLLHGP